MMQIPGLYMRRLPRQSARRGLGDAPTDLAAFHTTVGAGDTYLAGSEYDSAVQAYQAAGQSGATTLGPEIDSYTSGASKSTTLEAWGLNSGLQAIPKTGNASQAAQMAQSLAAQMGKLYDQAISMAPTLPPPPTPTTSAPIATFPSQTPSPSPTLSWPSAPPVTPAPTAAAQAAGTDYTTPILVGASVVGLGIIGWAAYRRFRSR